MQATHKFKFLGNVPDSKLKSFVVSVTEDEFKRISKFPYPKTMGAAVIESKNNQVTIGEYKDNFCNPYYEMNYYGWPVFVKVG